MLNRKVSRNLLTYLAYQAVRYIAPIALTPFLAHALGKPRFADLVILNSCIWTSTVFMEFGFYLYGINKTAAATNADELSRTVTAIAASKAVLAPFALIAYFGLAAWAGLLSRDPATVAIGALSAFGYGASFAWFFQGQERGGMAVTTEAIPQVLYYALIFALVRQPADFSLAVALQTIPPVVSLLVAFLLIRRTTRLGPLDTAAVRATLAEALPYFVERFCFTLYTAISPTLIAVLTVRSEASYYSIGDRVGIFLGTAMTPFFQAATPAVARAVRQQQGAWRLSLLTVAAVTGAVACFAGIAYFSVGFVIGKLFAPDYAPAIHVAKIFCITSVISVFGMSLANFVLIPRNAARVMIWSSSIALAAGLCMQWLLVPKWGAIGSVLSRGLSESIVAVILGSVTLVLIRRDLKKQSHSLHWEEPVSPESEAGPTAIMGINFPEGMNSPPKISVVLPVFNGERYLEAALLSVFQQTFSDFELIVVDDGSTDSTRDILAAHAGDLRLRVLSLPHFGICAALNAGLQMARGEYIARLDSDDIMLPQRLERQLHFLTERPNLAGAASDYYIIDEAGQVCGYKKIPLYTPEHVMDCLRSGADLLFPHPTMMFRKSVALALGGYRREFEKCEDADLFLRMIEQGSFIIVQPEALIQFRYHNASITASSTRRQFHLKRIIFGNHRRRALKLPEVQVKDYFEQLRRQSFLGCCRTELLIQSAICMRKADQAGLRGQRFLKLLLVAGAGISNPADTFRKLRRLLKQAGAAHPVRLQNPAVRP